MEKIITKRNKKYYGYFLLNSCVIVLFASGVIIKINFYIEAQISALHLIADLFLYSWFSYFTVLRILQLHKRTPIYIINDEAITVNNKTSHFKDLLQVKLTNNHTLPALISANKKCYTLTFQNSSVINIYYEYYTEPILIKQLLERQASIINSTKTIA